MNIYYVTNKKPLSHNKRGSDPKRKEEFKKDFLDTYGHLYTGLPKIGCCRAVNFVFVL